jgi:hypothetical protein
MSSNHKRYVLSFFAKLLSAWVAMGSKYRKSSSMERSKSDVDDSQGVFVCPLFGGYIELPRPRQTWFRSAYEDPR